jgi:hypothetical protein
MVGYMTVHTPTERFDAAYDYVSGFGGPIDVTDVFDFGSPIKRLSIDAAEDIHTDKAKRPGAKALGFICLSEVNDRTRGMPITGAAIDRVELYRDAEGEVIPNFSSRTDIYVENAPGVNYGYPDTELEVPKDSCDIALHSALIAIEQVIQTHQARV